MCEANRRSAKEKAQIRKEAKGAKPRTAEKATEKEKTAILSKSKNFSINFFV